jgi:hAT family C-terminal dimerisation region
LKLDALFPNIFVVLRIFCTLPVTVAQAERSFSTLARVKNVLRSTMCQDRLTSLGTLAVEGPLARKLDFDAVIELFASKKARKAHFGSTYM